MLTALKYVLTDQYLNGKRINYWMSRTYSAVCHACYKRCGGNGLNIM